jgi:hypothetical protein
MSEEEFRGKLVEVLQEELGPGYSVKEKVNLIYWVMIDRNLEYKPKDPKNPRKDIRKGEYAFQADIAVGEERGGGFLPLVVIEVKYEGFHTHDVLAYSEKALKHKAIYPYVRYGLVDGGEDHIPLKFFIHNVGLDFAIAVKDIDNREERQSLVNTVKEQIEIARNLLDVFEGRKVKAFVARTLIQWSEHRSWAKNLSI